MKMKRAFVYLVFALIMSLALCGCGDTMEHGNITASPWPEVSTPVMPTPSAMVSATPQPDFSAGQNMDEPGFSPDIGAGMSENADNGVSPNTPVPTDEAR